MTFDYAHKNTSAGERQTPTAQFNSAALTDGLEKIFSDAAAREIPVSNRETLTFLSTVTAALRPAEILELGTAVGLSAAVMHYAFPEARVTTIEKDLNFYNESLNNFKNLNISQHITPVLGDAAQEIAKLEEGRFGLIFMDCAKVQYIKFLPLLKRILKRGGVLLADDVLLFGYVSGEVPVPPKRKMLARHVLEYVQAVTHDEELITTVLDVGNGVAMSVKK